MTILSRKNPQDPPVLYTSKRFVAPAVRREIGVWLSQGEARVLADMAGAAGLSPEAMARVLLATSLRGDFDSLTDSLRRIGEVKDVQEALIDRALLGGMPVAEVARLTKRDRAGLSRRRDRLRKN